MPVRIAAIVQTIADTPRYLCTWSDAVTFIENSFATSRPRAKTKFSKDKTTVSTPVHECIDVRLGPPEDDWLAMTAKTPARRVVMADIWNKIWSRFPATVTTERSYPKLATHEPAARTANNFGYDYGYRYDYNYDFVWVHGYGYGYGFAKFKVLTLRKEKSTNHENWMPRKN